MREIMIDWDLIKRFNPATFVWMSQARTWISSHILMVSFCVQRLKVGGDCFVELMIITV
jgi:hypothetical protein